MKRARKEIIQSICINGIIAATYAALTIAMSQVAYGPIQFRFSEILGHRMGILGCSTAEMKMSLGC